LIPDADFDLPDMRASTPHKKELPPGIYGALTVCVVRTLSCTAGGLCRVLCRVQCWTTRGFTEARYGIS
jgi:hypothetical protein